MKQLMLSLLGAGLVALAACNKQKPMEPQTQPAGQSQGSATAPVKRVKDPPVMFKAQMNKKTGLCWGRFGNCVVIKTIVITASAERQLSTAVKSGSGKAVAEILASEDLYDLRTYAMSAEQYDKIVSGGYYLEQAYDDGKEACFVASKSYPVTDESVEFAFEFAYGEMAE